MITKEFENLKLSALGMGMMRLPVKGQGDTPVDEAATAEMIAYAMEQGINYYDTAFGYHEGESEKAVGKILSKYPRESYYLADKFPGYDLANMDKVEEIFEEQLRRCNVDYFDFYMFHNVCEMNINEYLDEKYGILDYLLQQKKAGRIRHLGFSAHGSYEVMERFLEAYGDQMEFCQIQLNYLDWEFQNAKAKVDLLRQYHLPIWVMEPLRGGALASLSEENTGKLNALRPEESIPAWAFRFLETVPGVKMVLSGMSDFQQLKANIETFAEEKPLNRKEMDTLMDIADGMIREIGLPCTACKYCVSHCPQELDIPKLLELYNEHRSTAKGFGFIAPMALSAMPKEKHPGACIGCKSCEAVCPQQLNISQAMADFAEKVK
ncbi:aldo/keto reductase [Anaerovorax odorimutans]|uniref:Aldo/keto reductase n=1 Tax=Anaerovorax odorimutans TaxID=109327 RepID=A0ABT1RMV6_9FIRM|nr:aldo/keto reductase [Anaerovorax odorimutans]MCQ4636513.1 aldo/keto reductase [Anaerovorax odorimutans]